MILHYQEPGDDKDQALIRKLLPKRPLIEKFVLPALKRLMSKYLIECLQAELKIYRAFPKNGIFNIETFEPRNSKTCFMGQGFRDNGQITDSRLADYRKGIGTMYHKVWGNVTLLEVWAADHFGKYPEMVRAAFEYGFQKRKRIPELRFLISPFLITAETGEYQKREDDIDPEDQQDYFIDLLANARARKIHEEWKNKYLANRRSRGADDDEE